MTPFHYVGEAIRQLLLMIPLWSVRLLIVLSLVTLLVWVLRLPASITSPPEGARRWDENLKLGASLALLIQIVIYCVF